MGECFICGISEGKVFLFDAISDKGIIKICRNCLEKENFPLIKKTDVYEIPKTQKVYETLSKLSGKKELKEELIEQDKNLKDIVDKNFKKVISLKTESPKNLVRNFHWVIMRARKTRHITQKQLGEAISEPEIAIKMAEKGILPEFNSSFIEKLENCLKINLKKKLEPELIENKSEDISSSIITNSYEPVEKEIEGFGIDLNNTRNLTISDLKKLKEEKEEEILGRENFEEENYEEDNEDKDKDDFWDD
ncbi:hypothetical protein ES705_16922 [subsurface metagenome]